MLVSRNFRRFAAAAASLSALFLALDLLLVRSAGPRLLISNSLDLMVILLAALCCGYVAHRSSGYARQIWLLLAVAFAMQSLGQAITTYYQSYAAGTLAGPVPSDVIFFIWPAPVLLIFLPQSEEEPQRTDPLRLLDFLQVAIVAVTFYLYFFYSPARWQSRHFALLNEILWLYVARDSLFFLGFLVRARASRVSWLRSFSLVLAGVFLLEALSDGGYLINLGSAVSAASWGDLVFMFPCFLAVWYAVTWKQPESAALSAPATRTGDFFATQFLPMGMPLLVIFMAYAIARERSVVAWLAVTASVVCSTVRLHLTNRRQRRVAAHLLETEKALRRSEEMLSTAFRSSPDAFGINIYPNGPFMEVNEGFTRLTGYTRAETLGKTPGEMNLWAEAAERARRLAPLAEQGEIHDVEFRFRHKSGEILTGLMSAALLELDGQECSLMMVRDITARKEAEDVLRFSEERFRSLVQNLHVGVVTCDPQGRILYANQAALDLFCMTQEQIVGKTSVELGLVAMRHDGRRIPDAARPVPLVITTRHPVRSQVIGWRLPNRSDSIWTLVDAVPELNSGGEVVRVVVSFTDITEQRRATEALRESEERFRALVETQPVAVIMHRPDGRVEYANPAASRMLGLPDGTPAVGKLPAEAGIVTLAEDGRELSFEERPVTVALRTRSAIRDVVVGLRNTATGKTIWAFGSSVPHIDAKGNLIRSITSFIDISEQRRAADALRESEERFRTLVRDLHVAVVLHGLDGRIEFANPAAYRMFGVPVDTATGKFPGDYGVVPITEEGVDLPPDEHPVTAVLRTGTPIGNGVLGLRYPGFPDKIVWVFGNAVPQFDTEGKMVRVITTFADISEMRNAQNAIHKLSTELLQLQDEERRRLGRELHDGLAQTVLGINLSLAQVRQALKSDEKAAGRALERARTLTQQMSSEIRTLSYLLHPPLLDDLGLVSALKEYVHGFSERSGIDTQLNILGEFERMPQAVELALFRVVQEGLTNIQRHSGSTTAKIQLRQDESGVKLEIIDFGRGLAKPTNGSQEGREVRLGVGITGMRERMAQLGGHLEVISSPAGTTVRASILLSELRKDPEDVRGGQRVSLQ